MQPKKAACEEQNQAQPNIRNMHQNPTRKHKKPEKKRQLESKSAETITKTEGQGKGGLYKQVKFPGWVVRPTPHPQRGLLGGWSGIPPTHKEVCWVGGNRPSFFWAPPLEAICACPCGGSRRRACCPFLISVDVVVVAPASALLK